MTSEIEQWFLSNAKTIKVLKNQFVENFGNPELMNFGKYGPIKV